VFKETTLPSTERDPVSYCVQAEVRKAEESAKWNGCGGEGARGGDRGNLGRRSSVSSGIS